MLSDQRIQLSIIIPCYNEDKQIEGTLRKLVFFLKKQSYETEIIIANDGSEDNTVNKTKSIIKELNWSNYRIVEHFPNEGRGSILNKAFLSAKGKYAIYMDADLATELIHINDIIKVLDSGYMIVTGSRLIKGSDIKRPLLREILSRGYNYLVRFFFWHGIHDHQCGFKGINSRIAPFLIPQIASTGWFWDSELLLLAKIKLGLDVKEIPIKWTEHRKIGESKVKIMDTINSYLNKIYWMKKKLRTREYK